MTRFFVLPYTQASEGAKAIADALPEGKRLKLSGSTYSFQEGDCIINWGNGEAAYHRACVADKTLNYSVDVCINKKAFFERMQGHNIVPPFAFSKAEAIRHLSFPVICRTRIEGADGAGIVIANNADELVPAKLYTQLMAKHSEYRVHMGRRFDGEIVLICAQKKRVGFNHANGHIWTGEHVFMDWCDPVNLPRHVFDVTKRSMELMPELTFGGFDVIDTDSWGARVVEVNSAPMQTPTTAVKYAAFFQQYVADRDEAARPVVPVNVVMEEHTASIDMELEVNEVLRKLFNEPRRIMKMLKIYYANEPTGFVAIIGNIGEEAETVDSMAYRANPDDLAQELVNIAAEFGLTDEPIAFATVDELTAAYNREA